MKKVILNIASVLLVNISFAQWTNKNVDNGFDDPYKICYSKENNGSILKLERVGDQIIFYIQGGYFCSDSPLVDISLMVNNQWVKYSVVGIKNQQSDVLFLVEDIENDEMYLNFLKASSIKLRVNEEYCDTEIFQFNMSGSSSAIKFLK
jgi:hypothetical protein